MADLSEWGKESISLGSRDYETTQLSAFFYFLLKDGLPIGTIETMRRNARDIADRNGFVSLANDRYDLGQSITAALAVEFARFFLQKKSSD